MKDNFNFIKTIEPEIYNNIKSVESKIKSEDFNFALQLGIIFEFILKKQLGYNSGVQTSLNALITGYKDMYKEKTGTYVPSEVLDCMHTLQKIRNKHSHHNDSEILGLNLITKIYLLQCIWRSLISFYFDYKDKEFSMEKFDEKLYIEYEQKNNLSNNILLTNLDIKSEMTKIGDFILNVDNNFVIPEYQREYTWTPEVQCDELLEQLDIKYETDDKIFFGNIALSITKDTNNNFLHLIDGQQRITTSLLLFRAFYDIFNEKQVNLEIPIMPNELSYIFDKKNSVNNNESIFWKKYNNKLADRSIMSSLMNILFPTNNLIERNLQINNDKNKPYAKNFLHIKRFLNNYNIEELETMFLFFYNNYQISIISFNNIDASNEMEIFENLNSKGKDLNTFDVIKNYFYNLVNREEFSNNPKEVVTIFSSFFNLENQFRNRDNVPEEYETFFFNYLKYKQCFPKFKSIKEVSKKKKSLLMVMKQIIDKSKLSIVSFENLCNKVGRYLHIFAEIETKKYSSNTSDFYFAAQTLNNLKHKDLYIIIFYLVDVFTRESWDLDVRKVTWANDDSKKLFNESMFEIERYILFFMQVNGTGQSWKDSFEKLVKYLKSKENLTNFKENIPRKMRAWFENKMDQEKVNDEYKNLNVFPTVEQIKNSILNTKILDKNVALAFLNRIEISELNAKKGAIGQRIVYDKKTIEHIMPQTLNKDWDHISEEDHKSLIDNIGNLLLINSNENSKLSNKSFKQKKEIYFTSNTILANSPINIRNESIVKLDKWDRETIQMRNDYLYNKLVEIYEIY